MEKWNRPPAYVVQLIIKPRYIRSAILLDRLKFKTNCIRSELWSLLQRSEPTYSLRALWSGAWWVGVVLKGGSYDQLVMVCFFFFFSFWVSLLHALKFKVFIIIQSGCWQLIGDSAYAWGCWSLTYLPVYPRRRRIIPRIDMVCIYIYWVGLQLVVVMLGKCQSQYILIKSQASDGRCGQLRTPNARSRRIST